MKKRTLIATGACASIAMLAAAGAFVWRRMTAATYARFDTMFGRARVYQVEDDEGEPVRLLDVNGIVQSGTYLEDRYTELVFEYLKRYDVLFELVDDPHRICVLGCGGYDYPEHLIANHPPVIVDAVEIDPMITAIARRYFYLDRLIEEYETESSGRLNLICADALDHLKTTDKRYNAIVNDAFDAGTPPEHLTTRTFLEAVHARLVAGGAYLTNIVAPLEGPRSAFLYEQIALMETIFQDVRIFPCATEEFSSDDNVIVVAIS